MTWGLVESDEMSVQTTRRHIPEPGISDGSFICCFDWLNIRTCSHPRIPIHNYVRTTILFNSSVLFRCLSINLATCGGRALLFTTSTYRYHLHPHTHSFLNPAPSLLCYFYSGSCFVCARNCTEPPPSQTLFRLLVWTQPSRHIGSIPVKAYSQHHTRHRDN